MKSLLRIVLIVACLLVAGMGIVWAGQRGLLYFPTHDPPADTALALGVAPWRIDGEYTGYARVVPNPRRIWFYTHGNGGQAWQRAWALHCFDSHDSVYILEYPGYGDRPGSPSRKTLDAAALKAWRWLRQTYGDDKLIVLGESLGSGVACSLATVPEPPRHIVLVVPFDTLVSVAQEKFFFLPVRLLLRDKWDNIAALAHYQGKVDIFGAKYDRVIPVHHARNLAAHVPGAVYREFAGDHNWSNGYGVDLSKIE